MEHEDEGQGSTALTRFTVFLAKCLVAGTITIVFVIALVAIAEVPQ